MKRLSYFITALFISIFTISCTSDEPIGKWESMKWKYEGVSLRTKTKKVFTVTKKGGTYHFKCKNYGGFWLCAVEEKVNNTVNTYDGQNFDKTFPKSDQHNIYGGWTTANTKENVLTVTIAPNKTNTKRYVTVEVSAGDIFDQFYFEQE